jgi:hypothetical protein
MCEYKYKWWCLFTVCNKGLFFLILLIQCLNIFFLQAFENTLLIPGYAYFFIVFTHIVVSVTYNASIQYITWDIISSLLYINFIHLPFTPLYIRWVCCCNVQIFVTCNWNKICVCIDHSVTGIIRVRLWVQQNIFFQHNRVFAMEQIHL